jgi:hypothetical protein
LLVLFSPFSPFWHLFDYFGASTLLVDRQQVKYQVAERLATKSI